MRPLPRDFKAHLWKITQTQHPPGTFWILHPIESFTYRSNAIPSTCKRVTK